MNKSLLRTALLILLSVTLPLQAAVAASKGGCLSHAQDQPGPVGTAGAAGHSPDIAWRDRPHFGNHHVGLKVRASSSPQAAQPFDSQADPSAHASSVGASPCPHHQASDEPAASSEPDCNSCGWCCMGTALPSPSLQLPARLAQPAPTPSLAWAHVSPLLRALERPPRATLPAA